MSKIRLVLPYIFFLLLAALILDAGNPLFDEPARDGGFFLYAGSQILKGKIPYLDFWDSKGPAIFYVNALGLFLGQGSRWGVWGLEFIFIFVWISVLYKVLLKKWGEGAAIFGILVTVFGLHIVFGYGNYTEEYALLFNALALYLFLISADSERSNRDRNYFWIGVLFGLSFSFRANNIGGLFGILLSVFIFNLLNRKTFEAVKTVLFVLTGFIVPLLLWTLYFQIWGAAQDMIYASIIFNFSYASAKSREFLDYFGGFGRYGMSWVAWFTAFGYLVYGYEVLGKTFQRKPISLLDIFLLLWFPIEIFLSNLSGRNFSHYYISWALAVAVYGAAVYAGFESYVFELKFARNLRQVIIALLIFGLLALSPSFIKRYGDTFYKFLFNRDHRLEYSDPLSEYIRENTQQDDLVLTWYPEMTVNFISQRASPVKLVYYPLFLEGTLTAEAENGYINDLTSRRPEMIVDCSLAVNAIPSLDSLAREEQFSMPGVKKKMYIHPGMERIFSFVSENYHRETLIENCMVFRLNSE
jgi:hypothetical protein